MRRFQFPLERVLELRRTQLELEEARYRQALAAVNAVDRAREELNAALSEAEGETRSREAPSGADLAALGEYRRCIREQLEALARTRAERERAAASQQATMLEARRRCRLLERLRERRLAEWTAARDRELEEVASESFLAQWGSGVR